MLRGLAAVVVGFPAASIAAGPAEYVEEPNFEYGEHEIDFKYGTWKLKEARARETAASFGVGYGATQWWFTELHMKYEQIPGGRTRYDAFEWENIFQLTEHNEYAVDVGILTEIEKPRNSAEGYQLALGPLFQGDVGEFRWNANVILERVVHTDEARHTEMRYQLQAKYTLAPNFEIGAQAFGEMGQWDHWESSHNQSHRIGPAIFGKVKLGGREAIRYNAAWLHGVSAAAPRDTFRVQAEYEF